MTEATKKHKFPKFMGLLTSKGLDLTSFTTVLNNRGYDYKYQTVRRKLVGVSPLDYDDIVIFSKVLEVDESIFFNN